MPCRFGRREGQGEGEQKVKMGVGRTQETTKTGRAAAAVRHYGGGDDDGAAAGTEQSATEAAGCSAARIHATRADRG